MQTKQIKHLNITLVFCLFQRNFTGIPGELKLNICSKFLKTNIFEMFMYVAIKLGCYLIKIIFH